MPCDASGMAEIHRYFKAGFGEGSALVAGVVDGDSGHADRVGRQLELVSISLHGHHEFEDARFWDPLTDRAPGCALYVDRM